MCGAGAQFVENGRESSATVEQKDDPMWAAIAVVLEIAVCLFRSGAICDYVLVKQNRNPASIEITSARNIRCLEVMMPQGAVRDLFQFIAFQELNAANTRRRPQMIHD